MRGILKILLYGVIYKVGFIILDLQTFKEQILLIIIVVASITVCLLGEGE